MDAFNQILDMIKGIASSDKISLIIKAVLIVLTMVFSIFIYFFNLIKAKKDRKTTATQTANKDEQTTVESNNNTSVEVEKDYDKIKNEMKK